MENLTKNYALIGAAGFIAPRHLKAIKDTGNTLVAALDKHDSVGVLDSYFPDASFFTEFERFDRHIDKLRRKNGEHPIDYVSICSPNYLHDAHSRFALRSGANAICEKPLVINPWNLEGLEQIEQETGGKIFNILQLRLHPAIEQLKSAVEQRHSHKFDIDLTYITARGKWYFSSWKGNEEKSGGIATNIGVHFFDMLLWIFGAVQMSQTHCLSPQRAAGFMELEKARVRWFLSISENDLPEEVRERQRTFRSIRIDDEELEFSDGFTDLHTKSYQAILEGNGFGIEQAKASIQQVYTIRHSVSVGLKGDYHPFLKKCLQ